MGSQLKRIFEVKKNFATSQEREAAVVYLMAQLRPETLSTVHDFMHSEEWPHQFHLGFGTKVRNLLRAEFNWDDLLLDAEWSDLIETAAARFMKNAEK